MADLVYNMVNGSVGWVLFLEDERVGGVRHERSRVRGCDGRRFLPYPVWRRRSDCCAQHAEAQAQLKEAAN
jgi:hypothetical protein